MTSWDSTPSVNIIHKVAGRKPGQTSYGQGEPWRGILPAPAAGRQQYNASCRHGPIESMPRAPASTPFVLAGPDAYNVAGDSSMGRSARILRAPVGRAFHRSAKS